MKSLKEQILEWGWPEDEEVGCVTDFTTASMLVEAYSLGLFPWPRSERYVPWTSPLERGILEFKNFHKQRSFLKFLPKISKLWTISFDRAFQAVIEGCALAHSETWLTEDLRNSYCKLHEKGLAHSVECWEKDELIGGLYGVFIEGFFSAESMFYKKSQASKVCFYSLTKHLEKNKITWMDLQMITSFTQSLGALLVKRDEFYERYFLQRDLKKKIFWPKKHKFVEDYL